MFETTGDILNIVLAVGFGLIAVFLSITLFYAIFVLRDINETTKVMRKTVKQVNNMIIQPAKLISFIVDRAKNIAEIVESNIAKKAKKK